MKKDRFKKAKNPGKTTGLSESDLNKLVKKASLLVKECSKIENTRLEIFLKRHKD